MPATGVPLDWERALSSVQIRANGYGTRATTVVTVRADGLVNLFERSFDATDPEQWSDRHFEFMIDTASRPARLAAPGSNWAVSMDPRLREIHRLLGLQRPLHVHVPNTCLEVLVADDAVTVPLIERHGVCALSTAVACPRRRASAISDDSSRLPTPLPRASRVTAMRPMWPSGSSRPVPGPALLVEHHRMQRLRVPLVDLDVLGHLLLLDEHGSADGFGPFAQRRPVAQLHARHCMPFFASPAMTKLIFAGSTWRRKAALTCSTVTVRSFCSKAFENAKVRSRSM